MSGTLSSIKVKEGDTVEVGTLLGEVNQGKAEIVDIVKKTSKENNNQVEKNEDEEFTTFKTTPKKNKNKKTSKKTLVSKQENLSLINEKKEKNSNKTLVLEALVDEENYEEEDVNEIEKEKYIPPKTKKNLSPAVRLSLIHI